jgi:polyisoprenoid-binding protein YceI
MRAGFFWGRFNDVSGTITFDESQPSEISMDIGIDINSVDSGHPDLDRHLKSPDFFDSKEFPKMTFKSTSAKLVPTTRRSDDPVMAWEVTGNLMIRGKSRPITVKLEYWGSADMGRGELAGFETKFRVKRSEFGVNYGIKQGAVGDWVDVTVAFEVMK